ncbi:30S ribosomal protein S8 [Candidatus Woesearchaeota archaeon]|nr:30S ribosomal protein S8 [Candidatus Woesearchaeota archaeon]
MLNDPIANALSNIINHEKIGRKQVIIHPLSRTLRKILTIMQENKYVGNCEEISDTRGGITKLNLIGAINKCGVIKPRFSTTIQEYEKFEKRYLPAKGVGILIISTPKGIMTHQEAKQKHLGGKLLTYCY